MATVRDLRDAGWFWMHNSIIEEYGAKIGVHGIALYALLAKCANKDGRAVPSIRYMAKTLGIGTGTVQTYLEKLAQYYLIEVRQRTSEHGDLTSSEYSLLSPGKKEQGGVSTADTPVPVTDTPVSTVDTPMSGQDTPVSATDTQVCLQQTHGVSTADTEQYLLNKTYLEQDNNTHPPTPQTGNGCVRDVEAIDHLESTLTPPLPFTPGFEAVCAIYPAERQEGLHEAFATWRARDLEPRSPEIVAKVRHLLETTWLQKERRFIPLLRTWLDKGRYNDPLVAVEEQRPQRQKRTVQI